MTVSENLTPRGIPYLTPTDYVNEIPTAYQAIALATEDLIVSRNIPDVPTPVVDLKLRDNPHVAATGVAFVYIDTNVDNIAALFKWAEVWGVRITSETGEVMVNVEPNTGTSFVTDPLFKGTNHIYIYAIRGEVALGPSNTITARRN